MVFYHNTFLIKQFPNVGTCSCAECRGLILFYLKKMHSMDSNFKYMHIDYKDNKYVVDENGEVYINDKKYNYN
tara:strand:- start:1905 stop:2123 length:219 start_codon:yes stop_codon:yes gene_type:complete